MATHVVPLQPMEDHIEADIHPVAHEEPTQEPICWQELQPMQPTLEQTIPEGLYPVERTHAGAVVQGLYPMGGTPRWNRGKRKEGVTKTKCYGLTTAPIPRPLEGVHSSLRCLSSEATTTHTEALLPMKRLGITC